MIPAAFEYTRPASLDEAMRLLADGNGGAKIIAGGQSLLPILKLRLASPERLIDIGRLAELKGVRKLPDGRDRLVERGRAGVVERGRAHDWPPFALASRIARQTVWPVYGMSR